MKHLLTLLLLSASVAQAADSYGYLVFWQHPDQAEIVTQTQTTQENADKQTAAAQMQAFCQEQDKILAAGSGCLSITPLKNTCAAAAWPRRQGLLKAHNVVIAQNPDFSKVGNMALNACRKKYGNHAGCETETVFCTDQNLYHP